MKKQAHFKQQQQKHISRITRRMRDMFNWNRRQRERQQCEKRKEKKEKERKKK
jgi:tellurite resistance protein